MPAERLINTDLSTNLIDRRTYDEANAPPEVRLFLKLRSKTRDGEQLTSPSENLDVSVSIDELKILETTLGLSLEVYDERTYFEDSKPLEVQLAYGELDSLMKKLEPLFLHKLPLNSLEADAVFNSVEVKSPLRKFISDLDGELEFDFRLIYGAVEEYLDTLVKLTILNSSDYGDLEEYVTEALARTPRITSLLESLLDEEVDTILELSNPNLRAAIEQQIDSLHDKLIQRYSYSDVNPERTTPTGRSYSRSTNFLWNADLPQALIHKLSEIETESGANDLPDSDDYHGTQTAYFLARYFGVTLGGEVEGVPISLIASEYRTALRRKLYDPDRIHLNGYTIQIPHQEYSEPQVRKFSREELQLAPEYSHLKAPHLSAIEFWDSLLQSKIFESEPTHLSIGFYTYPKHRHLGVITVDRRKPHRPHRGFANKQNLSLAIGSIFGFDNQPPDYSNPDSFTLNVPNPRAIPLIDFACDIGQDNQSLIMRSLQDLKLKDAKPPSWALLQTDNSYHAVLVEPTKLTDVLPTWKHIFEAFSIHIGTDEARRIVSEVSKSLGKNEGSPIELKRETLPMVVSHAKRLKMHPDLRQEVAVDLGHFAYFLDNYLRYLQNESENAGYHRITPRQGGSSPTLIACTPDLVNELKS